MQKLKFFLITLIIFFGNSLMALAGFDKDDVYSPPSMPECSITSLQLIVQSGDCLIFEGEVGVGAGFSSSSALLGDSWFWLQTSAISQTEFGSIASIIKVNGSTLFSQTSTTNNINIS